VTKGYLRAKDDAPEGRPRRFFALTAAGVEALQASRELQARMWAGVQLPKPGRR
jgi:DNA-binding PadR family transcriptional regulator